MDGTHGPPTLATASALHRPLLSWYDDHRRDLPWRGTQDPYGIWVSEIMLQQTRVETVIPYYLRWMERFPDVVTLARADEEEVLMLWSGLGYYSRARNLHLAARVVAERPGGAMPTTAAALRRLPGIGPYTAGAIASIAFGEATPAVDGNVLRVLARLDADPRDLRAPATRSALTARAAGLVSPARPGDWNQALMELGATVCTPRRPRCPVCPLQASCAAFAAGSVQDLPVVSKKRPPRSEAIHLAWLEEEGHVLLVRRDEGLLAGLWGLPGGVADVDLSTHVAEQSGHQVRTGPSLGATEHRFTHRHWRMEIRRAERTAERTDAGCLESRWIPIADLKGVAASTAHRKAFAVACAPPAAPSP